MLLGMEYYQGSHFVYCCRYHIVLATKYRRKIFNDGTFVFFKKCVENITKRCPPIQVLEINHDRDHVHLLVSIPPTVSVGEFVRILKCNSSRLMRQEYAFLKKTYYYHDGIWSDSYFVSTAGLDEGAVRKYIEQQGKKDCGQTKFVF